MSSRNSTDWMWSQACELIEEAERMHRQFFRLASSERTQAVWEPPVDVFEDEENPGYYSAKFYLRPHFQLEGMDIGLSLVSRLPKTQK
jgi:predicted component of type VI protein secretion system